MIYGIGSCIGQFAASFDVPLPWEGSKTFCVCFVTCCFLEAKLC